MGAPAWAIGVKLFASEIQPIATRATATSLAQSANCVSPLRVKNRTSINHTDFLDYQFLRCVYHARAPRPLLLRSVLLVWGCHDANNCGWYDVHA